MNTTNSDTRHLVLFDLDGVLADERHRTRHALARKWDSYFAEIPGDDVYPEGRALYMGVRSLGVDVGYLTGRRYSHKADTLTWLGNHGFLTDVPLIMRRDYHDWQRLPEFKRDVIADLLDNDKSYNFITLYDDDPRVIEVVNTFFGAAEAEAVHCTWHVKPAKLVAAARA